jgi:uncharacterized RDD family membrane protein YckC
MSGVELDTIVEVETPEGVVLALRPAGLTSRLYAYLLDGVVRWTVLIIAAQVTALFGGVGVAFLLVAIFLLEWLYPVAFELSAWGATPGKRLFGLTVLMDDGLPVTPAASITRNLLRVADFLPFAYGAGIVSVLTRADCKRLGDLTAGTRVVYRPAPVAPVALGEHPPHAPAIELAPRAQAAIVAFAVRLPRLTPARADELARLAARPAGLPVDAGREITDRLLGVAQWLLGRR